MREVKFRLWCGNKKEWEKDEWNITQNGIIVDTRRKVQLKKETHFLSQYTGLKDKNDVEIYEGDIVNIYMPKVSCHTKETIVKKIVSFENGSFTLEWTGKDKQGFWATFISLSTDCSIEVIGNIYENPEFL